jgi:hypothetical protein
MCHFILVETDPLNLGLVRFSRLKKLTKRGFQGGGKLRNTKTLSCMISEKYFSIVVEKIR